MSNQLQNAGKSIVRSLNKGRVARGALPRLRGRPVGPGGARLPNGLKVSAEVNRLPGRLARLYLDVCRASVLWCVLALSAAASRTRGSANFQD
jgi:hypothetical protein